MLEPQPILSSQQIHVLENGSLYLRSLEPKHSGWYICDASNGVNKSPLESRARVTVTNLPKVSLQNMLNSGNMAGSSVSSVGGSISSTSSSSSMQHNHNMLHNHHNNNHNHNKQNFHLINIERIVLRKGIQTQLMCSAYGVDQPMTAEWLRPIFTGMMMIVVNNDSGNENDRDNDFRVGLSLKSKSQKQQQLDQLEKERESRIVLREETKLNEHRAYLYISHVARTDSGIYTCLGTNVNGHSVEFLELIVQESPDRPEQFRAQEINSRTIVLTWSLGFDGNSPIKSFVVQYRMYRNNLSESSSENDILQTLTNNNNKANQGNYYHYYYYYQV